MQFVVQKHAEMMLCWSRASTPAEGWYKAALSAAYRRVGRLSDAERIRSEVEQKARCKHVPFADCAFTPAALGYVDEALTT